MANANGNSKSVMSNPQTSAMEPTEQELKDLLAKFIFEKNLKISAEEAVKNEAFRRTAKTLWLGKKAKEKKEREEAERKELNEAMAIICDHVKRRLAELTDKVKALVINTELMPELPEPTTSEVYSEIEQIVRALGLQVKHERVTRVDVVSLTKKVLLAQKELKAKEAAHEGQILLNAMAEAMKTEAIVMDTVKDEQAPLRQPLWRQPLKSETDEVEKNNGDIIPAFVFENPANTKDFLAAERGHLVKCRLMALRRMKAIQNSDNPDQKLLKLLNQKQTEIQTIVNRVTQVYQSMFRVDPGLEENFCPSSIYHSIAPKFDKFFAELFSGIIPEKQKSVEKPSNSSPPKDLEALEKRKQLLKSTEEKLRKGGFSDTEAEKVAARIAKKFNGDIEAAALGKRVELDNVNLSDEEKQTTKTQLEMLVAAAGSTLEIIEERHKSRMNEQKARQEQEKAEKALKLASQDAVNLSAKKSRLLAEQQRKLVEARKQKDAQKKGKKNAGVSQHRK